MNSFLLNFWTLMLLISPWLLLGMSLSGLLHVLLPEGFIRRHLGGKGMMEVFKAVAVGVPMPLCSCGVIPAAIGLKKEGASDGAAIGFLISTPQTGVDSILVSASFLGWPFAIFKVFSALISGLIGGMLVNLFDHHPTTPAPPTPACPCCSGPNPATPPSAPSGPIPSRNKLNEALHFAFIVLLKDIYRWLIIGIILAAIISTAVPAGRLADFALTRGLPGMLIMLVIAMPMYICATASVPLAASLVLAGMSPGTALVLLIAGPTTNAATMGAIYRAFGKKNLAIYLLTVAVLSIVSGLLFDQVITIQPQNILHCHDEGILPRLCAIVLSAIFIGFISLDIRQILARRKPAACCHSSGK